MASKVLDQTRAYCRSHPNHAAAGAGVVLLGLIVGVATAWLARPGWSEYRLPRLGVLIALPAPPHFLSGGDALGPTVVESRSPHLATVMALFPRSTAPNNDLSAQAQIQRAMEYLGTRPGIGKLTYQVTQVASRGPSAWQVSGLFLNQDVPSRVVGTFVDTEAGTVHVLCLFSQEKRGIRTAQRVLRSLAVLPGPAE